MAIALATTSLVCSRNAQAESTGYADPPPDEVYVVSSQLPTEASYRPPPLRLPPASPFRISVGPVGRVSAHTFAPGLGTAIDFGRGPAGFRATAAFVKVGDADPLAQYGGEITLALPAYGRFVPTFGVGAALARVKRVDTAGVTTEGGANLGVGTLRGGVDVRLPFEDTDARALLGATVNVPVVRGEGAPSESTWALLGASVAVGFLKGATQKTCRPEREVVFRVGSARRFGHTLRTVTQPYLGGPDSPNGAPRWPAALEGPVPTSGMATAALIFAALSYFCLGPVGAIGGIVCALIGYREIAESEGKLGGKELCTVSLVLSTANLLFTVATIAAFVFGVGSAVSKAKSAPPPIYTSPYTSPAPFPSPSPTAKPRAGRGSESGQTTPMDVVSEVRIGAITLVDLPATNRPLAIELRDQQTKATAAKERVVLFVVTASCRPCMSVAAVLGDPKMQAALDHVRLVRVNGHDLREDLEGMGAQTAKIPGFYLLSPTPKAVDGITGAEWDEDTADNVAPVMRAFLRGVYTKRRSPFMAPGGTDDQPGDRDRLPGGLDL